ncbi:hypothetical protein R6Q59_010865 [Mikania micrantha]
MNSNNSYDNKKHRIADAIVVGGDGLDLDNCNNTIDCKAVMDGMVDEPEMDRRRVVVVARRLQMIVVAELGVLETVFAVFRVLDVGNQRVLKNPSMIEIDGVEKLNLGFCISRSGW